MNAPERPMPCLDSAGVETACVGADGFTWVGWATVAGTGATAREIAKARLASLDGEVFPERLETGAVGE